MQTQCQGNHLQANTDILSKYNTGINSKRDQNIIISSLEIGTMKHHEKFEVKITRCSAGIPKNLAPYTNVYNSTRYSFKV